MPDLWMPGAEHLDIGDHAPLDGGPAKAIAHITWDKNATKAKPSALVPYENLRTYFGSNPAGKAVAPHVLWDPFTGRISQFVPADSRSKSLADKAGGTRTNRAGSVVIQVEALFFPYCKVDGKVYAELEDTPCEGWEKLHAWIKSWGVPDTWPNGKPTAIPNRNERNWETQAGWYAHGDTPENDHVDPLSWPAFTKTPTPPVTGGGTPPTPPVITAPEDDMPDLLAETNDVDFAVPADAWTPIAMALDSAILQGPCRYTTTVYATITGTPGTRVDGRFQDYTLATKYASHDLAMHAGVIGPDGNLDLHLSRPGALDVGEQLRIELLASESVTVTFRVARGLVWR